MKTHKASMEGLLTIRQAREESGKTIDDPQWLEEASKIIQPDRDWEKVNEKYLAVSIGTWKRFLKGIPIKARTFEAFCQVLGLSWEEVVDNCQSQATMQPILLRQDWGDAPEVYSCYGRRQEREQLKKWILQDKCRLVLLLGQGGSGKTTLSLKLVQEIQHHFDYIIWRKLEASPLVEKILADAIKLFSNQQETIGLGTLKEKISRLINYLKTSRCLLILDNAESLLESESYIGKYREGYEGYGDLLKDVAQSFHQSCLIITSREKPKAINVIARKTKTVQLLALPGLTEEEGRKIFTSYGEFWGSEDEWKWVIEYFGGNPFALEIIAGAIQGGLRGNLSIFVEEYLNLGLGQFKEINNLLESQLARLSSTEQSIMYWVAINYEPVTDRELKEDIVVPMVKQELFQSLASLQHRRALIENTELGYTLAPVWREYIINGLIDKICEEIKTGRIELLNSYSLCQATAKDKIRETQVRKIITPLLERLNQELGGGKNVENKLKQMISNWQRQSSQAPGYLAGNITNLLCQLNTEFDNIED